VGDGRGAAARRSHPHGFHTFGEHRPDYEAAYTLSKFRVNGARYRHLGPVSAS
jgi:hypothetical protein